MVCWELPYEWILRNTPPANFNCLLQVAPSQLWSQNAATPVSVSVTNVAFCPWDSQLNHLQSELLVQHGLRHDFDNSSDYNNLMCNRPEAACGVIQIRLVSVSGFYLSVCQISWSSLKPFPRNMIQSHRWRHCRRFRCDNCRPEVPRHVQYGCKLGRYECLWKFWCFYMWLKEPLGLRWATTKNDDSRRRSCEYEAETPKLQVNAWQSLAHIGESTGQPEAAGIVISGHNVKSAVCYLFANLDKNMP